MKTTVTRKITQEIEIAEVEINIPRDEIEDSENGVPPELQSKFMVGDYWRIVVGIDTAKIADWPQGTAVELHTKPRDGGIYRLLGPDGKELAKIENNYVPNRVIPGSYGDYIELNINAEGVVTNWYPTHRIDVGAFFGSNED
jgi:hypothetical protein